MMMKKQLFLNVMMLLPMVASADAVEIDGIYYNLITKAKQAEVTSNPQMYKGSIVIPETVTYDSEDYNVTNIGEYSFKNCKELTSITIPNSVTSIGSDAFYDCKGLSSITIPNSVTGIKDNIFYGCTGLTSVIIPNSVLSIGSQAFYKCSGLTSITIPNSVTSIGDRAFSSCTGLTSITIPNSVTSIGESAFSVCFGLTSITIPNSVTSIGKSAFYGCSKLTSITIPNSVTSIGNQTFYGCSGLTSVTIGNSVTSIGYQAFYKCSGLAFITMGSSLKIIGNSAFEGCSGLASVIIPNSVTRIDNGAFFGCNGLTSITILNGVISISYNAFAYCNKLTSVTIPNSVTSIGAQAFCGCSDLTSVNIGSGTQLIDYRAFADCPNLADVYCYAENVPNTVSDAFENSYIGYATLHVPSAYINAYKASEPWKDFKSIVATDGETPTTQKCEKPTISYVNGQLKMNSATEGVEYVTEITDDDVKKHFDASISLTATYNISVYATKAGFDNSDVATATLCWIDSYPSSDGLTTNATRIAARPVLVKSSNGLLSVEGLDDETMVSVYTIDGKQTGSTTSHNGVASVATSINPGSIAIVKVGEKSIKVIMK